MTRRTLISQVADLIEECPDFTARDIADVLGKTPQRIHGVCRKYNKTFAEFKSEIIA